jgi:hypothetical protein
MVFRLEVLCLSVAGSAAGRGCEMYVYEFIIQIDSTNLFFNFGMPDAVVQVCERECGSRETSPPEPKIRK